MLPLTLLCLVTQHSVSTNRAEGEITSFDQQCERHRRCVSRLGDTSPHNQVSNDLSNPVPGMYVTAFHRLPGAEVLIEWLTLSRSTQVLERPAVHHAPFNHSNFSFPPIHSIRPLSHLPPHVRSQPSENSARDGPRTAQVVHSATLLHTIRACPVSRPRPLPLLSFLKFTPSIATHRSTPTASNWVSPMTEEGAFSFLSSTSKLKRLSKLLITALLQT